MKKIVFLLLTTIAFSAILFYRSTIRERELVILSTNDIHATIDLFPQLVSAVNQCRDTVATLLVDAGDRWTGNAFVDRAEGRLPIIELMNFAKYDVATFGNHEFDKGAALLQGAIDYAAFPIVCANMISFRDDLQNQLPAVTIKSTNGIKVCVTGVVTNYDNGHPDGTEEVFEGLEFTDPMEAAQRAVDGCRQADVRLLLSHMGDTKDVAFAQKTDDFDVIIGGHTHKLLDTIVNGTPVGQTFCRLANVGATTIRMKGNKIVSVDYRNIPLSSYPEDHDTKALVTKIESDPVLSATVGTLAQPVTSRAGFAQLLVETIVEATNSHIGFYHYGGIRLTEHDKGNVMLATVYNLEPFDSKIHTIEMTPAQMRKMIIAKFNDKGNTKESHRVDLFSNTPYTIIVDPAGEAVDVLFPRLYEGRRYRVALADYIGKKYPSIEGNNRTECDILITDELLRHFKDKSPIVLNSAPKQNIQRR